MPEGDLLTAQIFVWNAGAEDIVAHDFFADQPAFVDLWDGEISSYRILHETDDLVRGGSELKARRIIHPSIIQSEKVVDLRIHHWPPSAGFVIEVTYRKMGNRTPSFVLAGPIRDLRERTFSGLLSRIDLRKAHSLPRQLARAKLIAVTAGFGFSITVAVMLFHIQRWPMSSLQYWMSLLVAVAFEGAFITSNDKRKQITLKVSLPLAYWLRRPYG